MMGDPFELLKLLVAFFGLCYIVGHSRISLPLRLLVGGRPGVSAVAADSGAVLIAPRKPIPPLFPGAAFIIELLECPACLSWWLGFIWAGWHNWPGPEVIHLALIATASSFILGRVTGLIGEP